MCLDDEKFVSAKIGKRDLTCVNHWKTLDIENLKITKPTVLCFGGNRSMDERDANAFCKSAERLLNFDSLFGSRNRNDIDLIGISYGHYKGDKYKSQDGVETSSLTKSEIKKFATKVFRPLYLNDEGNRINKYTAMKNFNLITTFSHSYGSMAINSIIEEVYKDMINAGYTYADTCEIFSQIISVSYAPRGVISGVSNIQIISGCDGYDVPLNCNKKTKNIYYNHFYNVGENGKKGNGTVITDDNTISVFTTNMTNNPKIDDHVLKVLINAGQNISNEQSKFSGSIFSVAQDSLILSVKNSLHNYLSNDFVPKPSLNELYSNTRQILGKEQFDLEM